MKEKLYKCDMCGKTFARKNYLITHIRTHTGLKPYKCDSFRKVCVQREKISKLQLSERVIIKPEEVLLEDLVWENESDVNTVPNVSNTPINDQINKNLYKCDICLKTFARRGNLIRHINSHTGLKPFRCEICLKSFSQKSTLKSHSRTHTGEKPFQCDVCLKSFLFKSHLTQHTLSHTGIKPHECEICSKSFSKKSNLAKHILTHTDEQPYECKICLKSFSQSSILRNTKELILGKNHSNVMSV
ncbi:uncharacterized protein LOC143921501 [Arctopsyche grandis]|uniref:uncharacterized protein LOC143921501 n=1 Tax=Arctopsyche grandis TaxID=121162 RepID=UPI00406D9347